MSVKTVLIADNLPEFLNARKEFLELAGYKVVTSNNPRDARIVLEKGMVQLAILDIRLEDDEDENDDSGIILAKEKSHRHIPKILLTGHVSIDSAKEIYDPMIKGNPAIVGLITKHEGPMRMIEVVQGAFATHVKYDKPLVKAGEPLSVDDDVEYIERGFESELISRVQGMDYIMIIEPRQQGKTSLVGFLKRQPDFKNRIFICLETASPDCANELRWYERIGTGIIEYCRNRKMFEKSPAIPRSSHEWREFLYHLAKEAEDHKVYLTIILDEIGSINFPELYNFFYVIRELFITRQANPLFSHISFILLCSTDPWTLFETDKIGLFKNAKRISLPDFREDQIYRSLNKIRWPDVKKREIAERVFHWTAGQPYLTMKILEKLGSEPSSDKVDRIVDSLVREDYVLIHALMKELNEDPKASDFLKRILTGEAISYFPTRIPEQLKLDRIGFIKCDTTGNCVIRNRIYQQAVVMFSHYQDDGHDLSNETINSKEKAMNNPDQEIVIHLIKEAITFIADELKQFWRSSREKPKNKESAVEASEHPGMSQELEETLMQQVKSWRDQADLELLKRDLETALYNAKQYHIKCSKLKKQLPLAGPTELATIELNIEEAQSKEKEATEEIKKFMETLAKRKIIVERLLYLI